MNASVQIGARAEKDFRRLDGPTRQRVRSVLVDKLTTVPRPENLDAKPLAGLSPWRRVRVGDHRIVYRPLTVAKLRRTSAAVGWYVARIIGRQEFTKALKNL